MKKSHDGLLKDGTSRLARSSGGRGISPIMWVAVAACALGAFFLFRGQGGGESGIGDQHSVVAVGTDSAAVVGTGSPRSGDVEIAGETRELTPEQPSASAQKSQPGPEPAKPEPVVEKPAPKPVAKPAAKPAPPPTVVAKIQPLARGGWIVQTGSYGTVTNADQEAGRLRKAGLDARVKMGNLADGSIAYRVRIGYFASRDQAKAYAKQEKKLIPGAIAVHR